MKPSSCQIYLSLLIVLLVLAGCAPASEPAPGPSPRRAPAAAQSPLPVEASALPALFPVSTPVSLAPVQTSTPDFSRCLASGGRIEIASPLPYPGMPEGLDFRVYLPPCYDMQPQRSYPVLYLIHGQSFTDDQWQRLGAGQIADRLIASGEAVPFIIVMPRDRVWLDPDGDRFGLAFVDILLPWIDSHYRTIPDRAHRSIGGLSRGGAWALHLGLSHWQLFGAWGEHSGVVFSADAPHVLAWLKAIPPDQLPGVYLDDGDGDRYLYSMTELKRMLDYAGITYTWVSHPGYHNEEYWRAHVEEYLRWYVQPWSNGLP